MRKAPPNFGVRRRMNTAKVHSAIMMALALLMTGCATYRHRVSDDFRDAIRLNVGVGLGFYARAKATSFLDAGLGWGGYWQDIGLEDRYTDFIHPSLNGCPFPIGVIPGAIPDESPLTSLRMANVRGTSRAGLDGDYMVAGQLFDAKAIIKCDAYGARKGSPHRVFKNHEPSYTEQPYGLEAGAGLVFVNVNVGFDPVEFCDLLCTMCGWDLLHDNLVAEPVRASNGNQPLRSDTNRLSARAGGDRCRR